MTRPIKYVDQVHTVYEGTYLTQSMEEWQVRNEKTGKMIPTECERTNGYIETKHGIVIVRALDHPEYNYVELEMIHNGKEFYRKYKRYMTIRGIARKAKKFAKEVIKGEIK